MITYTQMTAKYLTVFSSLIIFLAGCSPTKNLNESEYLLNKNIIKTDRPELKDETSGFIRQKPNRRILGTIRFNLGIYNLANNGKETKFKKWVKNSMGEAPVLLDTFLITKTSEQLKLFMQNKGYFNVSVRDSIIYKEHKKANVLYEITSREAYKFRNLNYQIADDSVSKIVLNDAKNTHIKSGNNYETSVIQKERDRINKLLKNNGYYFFNQQYISFSIDTGLSTFEADVYLLISKETNAPPEERDTIKKGLPFEPYTIRHVYIRTDYDPIGKIDVIPEDTLFVGKFAFLYSNQLLFKPPLLLRHVFIESGNLFKLSDVEYTYRHLQDLENFKFINIKFSIVNNKDSTGNQLDCEILLTPSSRYDYKLEAEGTNSGGNIGIAGNISYRHKNIFGGSELLETSLKGGLEKQVVISDSSTESNSKLPFFNAYEIGPQISLEIPRFLIPFRTSRGYVYSNPTTNFLTSYNLQQRIEYKRNLLNLSYSYSWKQNAFVRHSIYPAEINYVQVDLQPAFEQDLLETGDPALINSYSNHVITNGRYVYIFNNQDLFKKINHIYFRTNLEFAGNSLWVINQLQNKTAETNDQLTFLGVPYAQYFRPDFDIRYYFVFNRTSELVYRLAAGIGYAFGNSTIMPFEKSFYLGGSNDMRAWKARRLGPGASQNTDQYEKTGDLKLNGNFEYRFDIFKKLKGAAFIDAGNIWLLKPAENRPNAEFKASTFIDEIAIGAGFGIRFDFTFFILRLDAAQKLKDPSKPAGDRWVASDNKLIGDTQINFGIGYPF